jgi:hypothetical protein
VIVIGLAAGAKSRVEIEREGAFADDGASASAARRETTTLTSETLA